MTLFSSLAYAQDFKLHTYPDIAPQVRVPIKLVPKGNRKISSSRVFAEDLVLCEGYAPVCSDVKNIFVTTIPVPEKPVAISCEKLKKIVMAEIPQVNADISCLGGAIKVFGIGKDPNVEQLKSDLQREVDRMLASVDAKKMIVKKVAVPNVKVWDSQYYFEFPEVKQLLQPLDLPYVPNQEIAVNLRYADSSLLAQTIKARVRLVVMNRVFFAKENFPAGTTLAANKVYLDWIKSGDVSQYLSKEERVDGRLLKRPVRKGQPIRARWLKSKSWVNRGSVVKLNIYSSGLVVRGRAKATSSGSKGDEVRVEYLKTRKKLVGTVTNPNEVRVDL